MPEWRLSFNPNLLHAGRPWGIEAEDGERQHFAEVRIAVPAYSLLVADVPRARGYLVACGRLVVDGDRARIEPEG